MRDETIVILFGILAICILFSLWKIATLEDQIYNLERKIKNE